MFVSMQAGGGTQGAAPLLGVAPDHLEEVRTGSPFNDDMLLQSCYVEASHDLSLPATHTLFLPLLPPSLPLLGSCDQVMIDQVC